MMPNPILQEHQRRNCETRDARSAMSGHRARVTQLIRESCPDGPASLCVLGAGNGNDIELPELVRCFERITLVDLDEESLSHAVSNLEGVSASVNLHGGVDVTGLLETFSSWNGRTVSERDAVAAIEIAQGASAPDIGKFDVVASTCLLTQLIDSICMAMPAGHPRFLELLLAVRNRHLEMIAELLNPNGIGILVSDFVSSKTAPELAAMSDSEVPDAAMHWIKNQNFFTGVNPFMLRSHYQTDLAIAALVEFKKMTRPWKWNIGMKQFAVCALSVQRLDS